MYGRLDQVGKPIKCPDCGAQTIVPPPQKVKPQKSLAAMEGEQYELWGVDECAVGRRDARSPTDVHRGRLPDVPDADARHRRPGRQEAQVSGLRHGERGAATRRPGEGRLVLTRDEDDIQIDTTLDPGERPAVIVPPRRPMLYEEEARAERARQAEKAARGDTRGPQYDDGGRPLMPRWPLVTRVLPFLFSKGVPARWAVLSVGLMAVSGLMVLGEWMMSQGQFGVAGGFNFMIMGFVVLAIWLAAAAAIAVTIVTESSEGNDEVQHWPSPVFTEWWGELLYVVFAALVSPCPGLARRAAAGRKSGGENTPVLGERARVLSDHPALATRRRLAVWHRLGASARQPGAISVHLAVLLRRAALRWLWCAWG